MYTVRTTSSKLAAGVGSHLDRSGNSRPDEAESGDGRCEHGSGVHVGKGCWDIGGLWFGVWDVAEKG
jgi:hypothetical protein